MFSLSIKNLNALPVRLLAGPRSELTEAAVAKIKDGADPSSLLMETINPDQQADVEVAEVDIVLAYLTTEPGHKGDGTFALDVRNNTEGHDVRAQYADPDEGDMEEATIASGQELTLEGDENWRFAFSLLGVQGAHDPTVDPDTFTKGA